MNNAMVKAAPGEVVRQEFGADQLARSSETTQTAMAEQARAKIESMYVMALKRPRNEFDARAKMLRACDRPAFADAAIYRKPIGGGKSVEGLSIRFAEEAARAWRNLRVEIFVTLDDSEKRAIQVEVTDLEANNTESLPVVVEKFIERKFVKEGEVPIRSRVNSHGELVYLFAADEGRLTTKQSAEIAKAKRQCVLHLIPGDILEECKKRCYEVMRNRDAQDPDAAKKIIFDAFGVIGVKPSDIEVYVGHDAAAFHVDELAELRAVLSAIKDGDCTWPEALAAKRGAPADGKADPKATAIKDKIAERKARGAKKAPAAKAAGATAAPPHDPATGEVDDSQMPEPGSNG